MSRTRLIYRGKRVLVHHGALKAKDCPWERGQVFTCGTCKRVACYCFGGEGPRCDDCEAAKQLREDLAAERRAAKGKA